MKLSQLMANTTVNTELKTKTGERDKQKTNKQIQTKRNKQISK